jgi:hypothetical protein
MAGKKTRAERRGKKRSMPYQETRSILNGACDMVMTEGNIFNVMSASCKLSKIVGVGKRRCGALAALSGRLKYRHQN